MRLKDLEKTLTNALNQIEQEDSIKHRNKKIDNNGWYSQKDKEDYYKKLKGITIKSDIKEITNLPIGEEI